MPPAVRRQNIWHFARRPLAENREIAGVVFHRIVGGEPLHRGGVWFVDIFGIGQFAARLAGQTDQPLRLFCLPHTRRIARPFIDGEAGTDPPIDRAGNRHSACCAKHRGGRGPAIQRRCDHCCQGVGAGAARSYALAQRGAAMSITIDMTGKVVLVTGAASGLGRAVAVRMAAAGARLCLVDRDAEGLAQTAELIGDGGGEVLLHPADLSDHHACREAVAKAVAHSASLMRCAMSRADLHGQHARYAARTAGSDARGQPRRTVPAVASGDPAPA